MTEGLATKEDLQRLQDALAQQLQAEAERAEEQSRAMKREVEAQLFAEAAARKAAEEERKLRELAEEA